MGFYHQIHTKTTCFGSGKGTKTDCCDTLFKGKTTCFACSAITMDNAKYTSSTSRSYKNIFWEC